MMSPPQGYVASSVIPSELWYNVRDYGAVGDNATDNVGFFSSAVAAVPEGATLFIPKGTYKGSNSTQLMNITKRIMIRGSGPDTILRQIGTGHCLVIDGAGGTAQGVYAGNLTLATEAGGGDALRLLNVHRSTFENILVPSCAAKAFNFQGSLLNTGLGLVAGNNLAYTVGTRAVPTHGLSLENLNAIGSNDNGFVGLTVEGILTSPGIGVNCSISNGNAFLGGTSEGNTIGVALGTTIGQVFLGFDLEVNGTDITGSTASHTFLGNPQPGGGPIAFVSFGNHQIRLDAATKLGLYNANTQVGLFTLDQTNHLLNFTALNAAGTQVASLRLDGRAAGTGGTGPDFSIMPTDGSNPVFTIDATTGKVTRMGANIATKGFGLAPVFGLDNRSGVTAVDGAPITLYAVPAGANQLFDAAIEIDATAFTSGTATYTMTYTENAVSQTIVVTATAINVVTGVRRLIQPDASTNITVQLTGVFTATVRLSAAIMQLA